MEGARQFEPKAIFIAFTFQFGGNATCNFKQISSRAAAWVEHDDIRISQTTRPTELHLKNVMNSPHLIANNLRWCVPNAKFFAKIGIEGF